VIAAVSALRSSTAAQRSASDCGAAATLAANAKTAVSSDDPAVREAFTASMGQTFYGQMMKAMRQTVGKSKYFHGGRGEQIFQQQLDQIVVEKMSRTCAAPMVDPMYEQFLLNRGRTG
jgi:peptidoglycan hydrolase FlgJ